MAKLLSRWKVISNIDKPLGNVTLIFLDKQWRTPTGTKSGLGTFNHRRHIQPKGPWYSNSTPCPPICPYVNENRKLMSRPSFTLSRSCSSLLFCLIGSSFFAYIRFFHSYCKIYKYSDSGPHQ